MQAAVVVTVKDTVPLRVLGASFRDLREHMPVAGLSLRVALLRRAPKPLRGLLEVLRHALA